MTPETIKEMCEGCTGIKQAEITEAYDASELQTKEIQPKVTDQTVLPDEGKTGFSSVTVKAVTSAIDANIVPENIKAGVTILGVTGTLEVTA